MASGLCTEEVNVDLSFSLMISFALQQPKRGAVLEVKAYFKSKYDSNRTMQVRDFVIEGVVQVHDT